MRSLVLVALVSTVAYADEPIKVRDTDVDRTLIDRVVKKRAKQLRACYTAALKVKPELGGKVIVDFRIEPTGKTSNVRASGLDDDLDRCIEKQFQLMVFRKSTAPATMHYPLVLVRAS